jgi:hypothetical protein
MVSGTKRRRVSLNILAMQSTTKDDEGETMIEEKQRKSQENGCRRDIETP